MILGRVADASGAGGIGAKVISLGAGAELSSGTEAIIILFFTRPWRRLIAGYGEDVDFFSRGRQYSLRFAPLHIDKLLNQVIHSQTAIFIVISLSTIRLALELIEFRNRHSQREDPVET